MVDESETVEAREEETLSSEDDSEISDLRDEVARLRASLDSERVWRKRLADVIHAVTSLVGPCAAEEVADKVSALVDSAALARLDPVARLEAVATEVKPAGAPPSVRRRLPDERRSVTHKFTVDGHKGYVTVGHYESGDPGEIFIRMAKTGSMVSGLMDSFATAISIALQHGVPLRVLCDKFEHSRFDPAGFTSNEEIPRASSIMDYLFHWLRNRYLLEEGTVAPATPPSIAESGEAAR